MWRTPWSIRASGTGRGLKRAWRAGRWRWIWGGGGGGGGGRHAPAETSSRLVWPPFRRHRLAVIGGSAAAFLSLVAVLAPWLAPYRPEQISLADRWGVPSRTHPLGP